MLFVDNVAISPNHGHDLDHHRHPISVASEIIMIVANSLITYIHSQHPVVVIINHCGDEYVFFPSFPHTD